MIGKQTITKIQFERLERTLEQAWGGRRMRRKLEERLRELGFDRVPSAAEWDRPSCFCEQVLRNVLVS